MAKPGPAEIFSEHRAFLFRSVYGVLGSVADTEDVLQETWLKWSRTQLERVERPRSYLARIAINQAIQQRRKLDRRRETYIGVWLPEPLVAADEVACSDDRAETLSMALLVVLESLTPLERAVFVLHEAFGYPLKEIAEILEREPAAVRQLAHRAREHVQARRPRRKADHDLHDDAVERFQAAALGGDLSALMEILAPDVTLWTDGGGKVRTATARPVRGRDKVARLLAAVAGDHPARLIECPAPNNATRLFHPSGDPYAYVSLAVDPETALVTDIYIVTNPDKLHPLGCPDGH